MINEKELEKINKTLDSLFPYLENYRAWKKRPDETEEDEESSTDPRKALFSYLRKLDNEQLKVILAVCYFGSEKEADFKQTLEQAEKYDSEGNSKLTERLEKKVGILYPAIMAGKNRLEEMVYPERKKTEPGKTKQEPQP